MLDPQRVDEYALLFTDDFVIEDRRKVIGHEDMDKRAYLESSLPISHEAGLTMPVLRAVASRGDRLVLLRVEERFADGSERKYLTLACMNTALSRVERSVLFDIDDPGIAMVELDRLNAELTADSP